MPRSAQINKDTDTASDDVLMLRDAYDREADEQDGLGYYSIRWVYSRKRYILGAITSITRLLDHMPTLLFNSISKPHDVSFLIIYHSLRFAVSEPK